MPQGEIFDIIIRQCNIQYSLQRENTNTLCQSLVTVAQECPPLIESARALADQFTTTFSLFAVCHNLYSSKFLSEVNISNLGMFQNIPAES
jgi:hypothetical protein